MTKQEQDILHEYKETVCVFVRISKNLYFSTHFCNVLLKRARRFFISCLRRRVGKIRSSKHTRLVVKMTGSDVIQSKHGWGTASRNQTAHNMESVQSQQSRGSIRISSVLPAYCSITYLSLLKLQFRSTFVYCRILTEG